MRSWRRNWLTRVRCDKSINQSIFFWKDNKQGHLYFPPYLFDLHQSWSYSNEGIHANVLCWSSSQRRTQNSMELCGALGGRAVWVGVFPNTKEEIPWNDAEVRYGARLGVCRETGQVLEMLALTEVREGEMKRIHSPSPKLPLSLSSCDGKQRSDSLPWNTPFWGGKERIHEDDTWEQWGPSEGTDWLE